MLPWDKLKFKPLRSSLEIHLQLWQNSDPLSPEHVCLGPGFRSGPRLVLSGQGIQGIYQGILFLRGAYVSHNRR